MPLATRCSGCSTVFLITTVEAAAKGGMVRCGLCRRAFNALDALVRVEDLDRIDEVGVGPPPVVPVTDAVDPAPPAIEASASSETVAPLNNFDAAAPGQRATIGEWWLPEAAAPDPIGDEPAAVVAAPTDAADRLLSGRRTDLQWPAAEPEGTGPTFMRPEAAMPPTGGAARWGMGVLIVVALLALLVQGAYQWRDELAVRWPPARAALVAMCVPLRCMVDYPAHLAAVGIESANVQVAGPTPNVYLLTALLRNRDTVEVRYPHLELVLTDLQDRPILRRALRPEDYLPPRRDIGGFAAESELPIRVTFELTDLRFTGYRLERFYP